MEDLTKIRAILFDFVGVLMRVLPAPSDSIADEINRAIDSDFQRKVRSTRAYPG